MSKHHWLRATREFTIAAFRNTVLAALLGAAVLAVPSALAQVPEDTGVSDMRHRLQSLQQQLDSIDSARDAATRQRLMLQSWQGMQDYMGWMRDRWGLGYPWMRGYRGMGGPMMGAAMGCPMMGGGSALAWPLPPGMSPTRYSQQMRDYMRSMQQQMSRIAQSGDSQARRRLLEEHWQTMYQEMQTMRGMGWMWAGPMMPGMMWRPMPGAGAAAPLPEASSRGATLVATYCTQCHAAPSPTLHTSAEWESVLNRMQVHIRSGLPGIKTPSEEEMRTLLTYMQRHAR